jgi:geranylgeranyl reductase family protein
MAEATDVLIVGGGPAGSATAVRLARAGLTVRLLDRAIFPRQKPCSEYASPETVRQLDDLGVLAALEADGATPLDGTVVTGPGGARMTGRFARAGGTPFRATGLALRRDRLDTELLGAAVRAGADVREGVRVSDLVHDDTAVRGVVVRTRAGGGEEHRARLVIGADGLRSVVSRRAGLHREGRLRRVAVVTHVRDVTGLGASAELHVSAGGYLGLNPIGHGVTNVALVLPARAAKDAGGAGERLLRDHLAGHPALGRRVDLDRRLTVVRAIGPFDASCRRSVADGLLLVGDAADFFDPFTGEGIHSALVGSALAAAVIPEALARVRFPTARDLAGYRQLRRRAFLGKWIVERLIGYAMLAPWLFDRAVRNLARRGMADALIGVTGGFVSPSRILNPAALAKIVV